MHTGWITVLLTMLTCYCEHQYIICILPVSIPLFRVVYMYKLNLSSMGRWYILIF